MPGGRFESSHEPGELGIGRARQEKDVLQRHGIGDASRISQESFQGFSRREARASEAFIEGTATDGAIPDKGQNRFRRLVDECSENSFQPQLLRHMKRPDADFFCDSFYPLLRCFIVIRRRR